MHCTFTNVSMACDRSSLTAVKCSLECNAELFWGVTSAQISKALYSVHQWEDLDAVFVDQVPEKLLLCSGREETICRDAQCNI